MIDVSIYGTEHSKGEYKLLKKTMMKLAEQAYQQHRGLPDSNEWSVIPWTHGEPFEVRLDRFTGDIMIIYEDETMYTYDKDTLIPIEYEG